METNTSASTKIDGKATAGLPAGPPVRSRTEESVGWSPPEEAWFDRGERGLCTWDHDGRPQPGGDLPRTRRSILLIVWIANGLALGLLALLHGALS